MANKNKKVSKVKVKTPKVKKIVETPPKLEVKLVSYIIQATIPTMMYGNITPRIEVQARTMEDAKRAVMPHIEELFQVYLEEPRDGKPARFTQKANVSVEKKEVKPVDIIPGKSTTPPPEPVKKEEPKAPEKNPIDEDDAPVEKSPAYLKAESAVKNAMSKDALNMIEEQIQKSVKLTADEKPLLLTELLKKRKEFN